MEDLFGVEQKILDDAALYLEELKNGAVFYLDKFDELVKEYGRLLKQLRRITKMSDRTTGSLVTSKIDLMDKVHYDALTGIYNRRFMEENLKRLIKSMARSGDFLTVMMLDIDFFKKYNDTYGHSQGDVCIRSIAQAVAGCLTRTDDFTARYGGEEFAVILPNTGEKGARFVATKLLEIVKALNIPHEKSEITGCVTISIGITTGRVVPSAGLSGLPVQAGAAFRLHWPSGEDYIKRADTALYQSKQNGRNRYTYMDFEYSTYTREEA